MQPSSFNKWHSHSTLAYFCTYLGSIPRADALLTESLEVISEIHDEDNLPDCLGALAGVARTDGRAARAVQLLGAAEGLRTSLEEPLPPVARAEHEALVASAGLLLDPNQFAAAWEKGWTMTAEEAVRYALSAGEEGARLAP